MCFFATCGGCVTGMHWNAVLPKILKVLCRKLGEQSSAHQKITAKFQDSWGWRNFPPSEIFRFQNYPHRNCPLTIPPPPPRVQDICLCCIHCSLCSTFSNNNFFERLMPYSVESSTTCDTVPISQPSCTMRGLCCNKTEFCDVHTFNGKMWCEYMN